MDSSMVTIRRDSGYVGGGGVEEAVVRQIEFYLGRANLPTDYYLLQQMDVQYWVSVETLSLFPKMRRFGMSVERIAEVLAEISTEIEVDRKRMVARPKYMVNEKRRSALILRDVPENTSYQQLLDLFSAEHCPSPTSMRPDVANVWFVNFNGADDARTCLEFIQEKELNGAPVRARVKSIIASPSDAAPATPPAAVQFRQAPNSSYQEATPSSSQTDAFRGGRPKNRPKKVVPVGAVTRRSRRRSLTKQKPDSVQAAEDASVESGIMDEELMASGEHFPPLKNRSSDGSDIASNNNNNKESNHSSGSEAPSESDIGMDTVALETSPATDAPKTEMSGVEKDGQVGGEKSGETSKETKVTTTAPAAATAPKSYAAILRTKSVAKVEEKPRLPRKPTKNQENDRKAFSEKENTKSMSITKDGSAKQHGNPTSSKSNGGSAPSKAKAVTAHVPTKPARAENVPQKPKYAPVKVSPVAQQSASVWQNKPRAVLEAPQLRCVEKRSDSAMKVESAPQMVQSS